MSHFVNDKFVTESFSLLVKQWVSERVVKLIYLWLTELVRDWMSEFVTKWVSSWLTELIWDWLSEYVSE